MDGIGLGLQAVFPVPKTWCLISVYFIFIYEF